MDFTRYIKGVGMNKKLTDKQMAKRQSALAKIDNVFKKANEAGLNKKGKERVGNSTYEQYAETVKNYYEYASEKYNIHNPSKLKQKYFESYLEDEVISKWREGDVSVSFSVRKKIAAVDAFKTATSHFNDFKGQVDAIDHDKALETLKDNYIVRKADYTGTMIGNKEITEEMYKELDKMSNRTHHAVAAKDAYELARTTGARVEDILKLTPSDIKGDEIEFRSGKGNLTARVRLNNDAKAVLERLSEGKKENEPLIVLYRNNMKNQAYGREQAANKLTQLIGSASKKAMRNLGVASEKTVKYAYKGADGRKHYTNTTVKQSYTMHSGRKEFAQSEYKRFMAMDLKEIDKLLKEYKGIGGNYERGIEKLNNGYNNKVNKCLLLAAFQIRHFRTDVISQYYVDKNILKDDRKEFKGRTRKI